MTLRELTLAVCLEAMSCDMRDRLLKQGIILTREAWFKAPGVALISPLGAAKLAALGIEIVGWNSMVPMPPPVHGRPHGVRN